MSEERPAGQTPPTDMGKVYDEFAEAFREADKLPTWVHVGKSAMGKLLGEFFNKPEIRFLDLGSASARLEAWLLENGIAPGQMTGVEISPDQVELARKRIPGADFRVGDITKVSLPPEAYDVAFSHMVFEHLDDEQLLAACKNAYASLKPGGTFAFVVTHPSKMTHLDGSPVTEDGPFETTAPWGGVLHNWRRSVEKTEDIVTAAGFTVESVEEVPFPESAREEDPQSYEHYKKYPYIRLAVKARKPGT